jgi:hypothetical protein
MRPNPIQRLGVRNHDKIHNLTHFPFGVGMRSSRSVHFLEGKIMGWLYRIYSDNKVSKKSVAFKYQFAGDKPTEQETRYFDAQSTSYLNDHNEALFGRVVPASALTFGLLIDQDNDPGANAINIPPQR